MGAVNQELLWANVQTCDDWTFNKSNTRFLTHCYHDYPARMIPQVADKLIKLFAGPSATLVFDPYCGTGTSLVQALVNGKDAVGTDLNPLARLIATAKTTVVDLPEINRQIKRISAACVGQRASAIPTAINGIIRLDFWFKPAVVERLALLQELIDSIEDCGVRTFFQVAFSEVVRESSNTRNHEFKLYRYDKDTLAGHAPDVVGLMMSKLERNRKGLLEFTQRMAAFQRQPSARIFDFNTVAGIPSHALADDSVDIVVTSPPYGDSHTTVAYGQYSKLSAAWLGMADPEKVDGRLMGGSRVKTIPSFSCPDLDDAIASVASNDRSRALEVAAFYADLRKSVNNVSLVIKPGGHACYVVGNRRVKGVTLPTDAAIRSFFEVNGLAFVETFKRDIPNKRMPHKNSPTNAPGVLDSTMTNEFIVVMQKPFARLVCEGMASYTATPKRRKRVKVAPKKRVRTRKTKKR